LITIDKEIDLHSLNILQKLSNTFKNKIKIRILNNYQTSNTFSGEYSINTINDVKKIF